MKNNIKFEGGKIKEIFKEFKQVANLHTTLTSPTGHSFRMKVLQDLRKGLTTGQLREMRRKAKLHEQTRHIDKLIDFELTKYNKNKMVYVRTKKGENVLNAIREFERKIGKKGADKIFKASLGPNSIQLFLAVYGNKKSIKSHPFLDRLRKPKRLTIKYSPSEIGRIAGLLPRTIEGLSAIDKLDDSGILKYEDDGYVHFSTIKARGFYQYLRKLHEILEER